MNSIQLLQYALGSGFGILNQVTSDLTQEQADWQPPGIANPIGATYWHAVTSTDGIVHRWCMGRSPLQESEEWEGKLLTTTAQEPERGGDYHAYMRAIRVDLAALHEYTQAVSEAIQTWLCNLEPQDLERKLETPVGELSLAEVMETFVIWHINAHCGEIAALKGCQGVQGYPF